jgi:hypothetical protein
MRRNGQYLRHDLQSSIKGSFGDVNVEPAGLPREQIPCSFFRLRLQR